MKKLSAYLYLKDSYIHNKGVFASRRIPKGIFLLEYVGEKVDKEESERREKQTLQNSKQNSTGAVYMFELNETYDIDGDVSYNPAKYINHSCNPNSEIFYLNGKIWIVAKRNIKKKEEISYNYCFDMENYKEHPCKCRSSNCIGYILDEKYRNSI